MVEKRDLLVEIGTEELPPLALVKLSEAFRDLFGRQLEQAHLAHQGIEAFATPRRLALRVSGLDARQQDREQVRKGPALQAAFDASGAPTKAAQGFARSCGVDVTDLEREETDKGAWLCYRKIEPGKETASLLPAMVESALGGLPIPKRMRWADLEAEFVRPVHDVVLLFGEQVVEGEVLGIKTGRRTRGHRFHHPELIELNNPEEYEQVLEERGRVIVDFTKRRETVRQQAIEVAEKSGARAVISDGLLDEITALVEWPVAILGSFDRDFLEVPPEVLIETMQKNQKYFPVVDQQGNLKANFITISNLQSIDPNQVRAGNERVIRPRFKDASFFWEQDLKQPLANLAARLGNVVFQEKLGTIKDKSERISVIASAIAKETGLDVALAKRAAMLCKCDLLTNMVGEFPSLQGLMGKYYAQANGEAAEVSQAVEEHYLPRYAGDRLPSVPCGQALALADRIDSLVGIFAAGLKPTGVKDPYGLRRAALGVLRILIETPLPLDLKDLVNTSADTLAGKLDAQPILDDVLGYVMERLHAYYADKGIPADVVDSVLALDPTKPSDIDLRVKAVMHFRGLAEARSLAEANKRIRNIIRKSEIKVSGLADASLFEDPSEGALQRQVEQLEADIAPLLQEGDYEAALDRLAGLKEVVDAFFDEVMVNCEDEDLRANRHRLLGSVGDLFLKVADISRLQ